MSASIRYAFASLWIVVAAAFIGCSGDGRLAIEGTATWNGEPIEKGFVEFFPVDGNGQIDGANIEDGKFSVRIHEGEKRVRVTAEMKIGETPPTERIPNPEPIYAQYIPKEFNDQSELKVNITKADPKIQLTLKGRVLNTAPTLTAAEIQRKTAQGGK